MHIHDDLISFLPKKYIELNRLLFEKDRLEDNIKYGDTTSLCDIHGICEVDNPSDDDTVGNCFYCGTELRKHNNSWYHHTAFDRFGDIIDESFQTHDYYGAKYGEPTSLEARELLEITAKINEIIQSDTLKSKL